jgi:uncharacterized cupin superfamily protein
MKPFINLFDLNDFISQEEGPFQERYAAISEMIGAKKLSYSFAIIPPGKKMCPFHNHRINEELFIIIEGRGLLRFGDDSYEVKPFDVIACPAGDRSVAHQIINTSESDLKYFCLSTNEPYDICEYPTQIKFWRWINRPKLSCAIFQKHRR